jgi:hypothetical protein
MPPAQTIDDVLERMRELDAELGENDGVRWFNRLYLAVTEAVAGSLGDWPEHSPGFLKALDIAFANLYFQALDAAGDGPRVPQDYRHHAWKPLFANRRRRDVAPIQFALAGMNAHINHDLALALQDVCRDRGVAVRHGSREHDDFTAVNDLLERVEAQVKVWLLTGALAEIDRHFGPVDDIVAIWSIGNAREAAWTHGEVLSHFRDTGFVETRYRAVLDRTTGAYSRALLAPVGVYEGAPRFTLEVSAGALVPVS